VFTLNYDLLTYWALMNNRAAAEIVDFFWNNPFDPVDTELRSTSASGLVFLHGGIHLWQDTLTGETGKWTNQRQGGLLSQLGDALSSSPNRLPLIVSEGRSEQKQRAIRRSDYLSFGYQQLTENNDPIVIFGASFGSQDDHIVKAVRKGGRRAVAISVYPRSRPRFSGGNEGYLSRKLAGPRSLLFRFHYPPAGRRKDASSRQLIRNSIRIVAGSTCYPQFGCARTTTSSGAACRRLLQFECGRGEAR
jgi:Domain of unknown function (DUF4917)